MPDAMEAATNARYRGPQIVSNRVRHSHRLRCDAPRILHDAVDRVGKEIQFVLRPSRGTGVESLPATISWLARCKSRTRRKGGEGDSCDLQAGGGREVAAIENAEHRAM